MGNKQNLNLLLVDDKPANLKALETVLRQPELSIFKAESGNRALELVLEQDFALVLLDVQMPGMDGYEVAELMRGNKDTRHIPIIFVTAINEEDTQIFKGYEAGAVDFLFKPLNPNILLGKVNIFLELHRQKIALLDANSELKHANSKIQAQQQAVIEEERLKVLLQMAGATAHELNQPLMALLGNIELMEMFDDQPDKQMRFIHRIKEAGERISEIVKKIQTIRHDEVKPYDDKSMIINLDQKINILCVEDSDDDFQLIGDILVKHDWITMTRARDLKSSWKLIRKNKYDLVFLDYVIKGGTGFDVLSRLNKERIDTPVVMVTGQGDEMLASKTIQLGAYDYLPKSKVTESAILRVINNTLERARLRMEMKKAQDKIAEMSILDELTQLYNRRYFNEALEREMSKAQRYESQLVLCILDLDHFKKINDVYGHPAGDKALNEIGRLLEKCFRKSDLLCRYGGEEFAVIIPNTRSDKAYTACDRFRKMVARNVFRYRHMEFKLTVSVGLARLEDIPAETVDGFIEIADRALYEAKTSGRNRVALYDIAKMSVKTERESKTV
ncbi:MAG: diguanylate cyclase [Desulfobacteraceae bacterium]|nr:diguanylate cyclase [Desulfobacteraceae bacterium]